MDGGVIMKTKPIQPGQMKATGLNLKQSDRVRKSLSKARFGVEALKRMQPVELNWRTK